MVIQLLVSIFCAYALHDNPLHAEPTASSMRGDDAEPAQAVLTCRTPTPEDADT